jgi:tRNA threonylcarbamoyl adenosine modification protein (Sua5/YciO/YrdC/YwlC family)
VISDPIGDAVSWIRAGGLLAYPTETVWGLGADAATDASLERLRRWKGRGEAEPISILVEDAADLETLGFRLGSAAERLAATFWPGPLTLVLSCERQFGRGVARSDGAVGVRCSAHPLAAAIARRLRSQGVGPITATSLNPSGAPPAHTREEARAACGSDLEVPRMLEVSRAEAGGGPASTVVDLTGEQPRVLRWGALRAAQLEPVLQEVPEP